ncbi:hypothetical protein CR513_50006, partial [Mucuna pruriens]
MTSFPSYFTSYSKTSKKQPIIVANGDHVPIARSGNVQLKSSLELILQHGGRLELLKRRVNHTTYNIQR